MSTLDHTTALWADGVELMAWLDRIVFVQPPTATARRRLDRWRGGAQASFWHVDKVLISVGLHPSQVPSEFWRPYDNGRRCRQPPPSAVGA